MKNGLDLIVNVKKILDDVLSQINLGKNKIFNISDRLRDEYEEKRKELETVDHELLTVINDVDKLEKEDKIMRNKLVIESKKLDEVNNEDLKNIYDKAIDIRVKYITKQNEEKNLIKRRDSLQRNLKNYIMSIHEAENAISQISVAIDFLNGNLIDTLNSNDEKNKSNNVIKILENQEKEKRRIARDIHDGPAQYIANVIMRIDFCKVVVKKDIERGVQELEDLKIHTKRALKEVRSIIYGLNPIHLEELGIKGSIEEIAMEVIKDYGINMYYEFNEDAEKIEGATKITAYRIIQEIINNVKKHSRAKNVNLKVYVSKRILNISIEDDGVGFNFKETIEKIKIDGNKYGIIGIIERVNQLEGKIKITSSFGGGTIYNINLPIERKVESYGK